MYKSIEVMTLGGGSQLFKAEKSSGFLVALLPSKTNDYPLLVIKQKTGRKAYIVAVFASWVYWKGWKWH